MPHRLPLSRLKKLFHSSPGRCQPILSRAPRTRKPFLELLEDRCLLSNYMVTDTSYSGTGSLGAAITAAVTNNDSAAVITFSDVPAHSTIQLNSSDVNTAAAQYGPTAFFINGGSGTNITIDGSGAPGLVIDGGSAVRLFTVASGDSLTLENLTLSNGLAQGGDSIEAGGGGAGLGGAAFNQGTLTLDRVTLTGNQAIGGMGGFDFIGGFGSGGGLGGSASYSSGGGPNGGTASDPTGGFGGGGYTGGTGGFGGGGGIGANGGFGGGGGGGNTSGGFGGGNGGTLSYAIEGEVFMYAGSGGGAGLGGAVFNDQGGQLTITNSTFTGNTAQGGENHDYGGGGSGYGGAVFNRNGTVTIQSSTLAGNTVTSGVGDVEDGFANGSAGGGAVFNLGDGGTGNVSLTNTILAYTAGGATDYQDAVINGGSVGSSGTNNLIQNNNDFITGGAITGQDPLLAPLGNYGGPTQTMALLPGSPAIGGGTTTGAPATDQRGYTPGSSVDIGAFQDQGFTIAITGGNGQTRQVSTAFANPLAVTVTANNTSQFTNPVNGGVITFTAPTSGASATLSAPTATISGGQASVTATANTVAGTYAVTASATGVTTPASFSLTNTPGAPASVAVVSGSNQSATVTTAFAAPLVVVVKDTYGNLVPAATVTFVAPMSGASAALTGSPATTGANGQASVTATAGTVAGGPYTVTASVSGVTTPASFSLTNTPGAPASVAVVSGSNQSATVATAFAAPLVVVVKDTYGNLVPAATVTFVAPMSGASAALTGTPATTGANGQASVTATAGTVAGGPYTVTASVFGVTTSFSLTNTPGAPASVAVVSGSNQSATVATAFAAPLVVVVKDTYGNLVPAATVTFVAPMSGASAALTGSPATTGTNGQASVTATANGIVGSYTVSATASGITTPASFSLTNDQLIIALDPSATGALSLAGNASIKTPGVVYVDSSSSSALSASGNAQIKASAIDVHGKVQKSGNASLSPAPVTGAPVLAVASLPPPSTTGMTKYGSFSLSGNSSATIQPGIYSQISVSGNAKLTMSSGIYIIEGGGLSVTGNASVTGSGVMIFNAGSNYPSTGGTYGSITLSGNATFNLSPATSGTYAGIVFFQPLDNTQALTVTANASGITGTIYAPGAQLSESGNAALDASLIVDTLTISGNGVAG